MLRISYPLEEAYESPYLQKTLETTPPSETPNLEETLKGLDPNAPCVVLDSVSNLFPVHKPKAVRGVTQLMVAMDDLAFWPERSKK